MYMYKLIIYKYIEILRGFTWHLPLTKRIRGKDTSKRGGGRESEKREEFVLFEREREREKRDLF